MSSRQEKPPPPRHSEIFHLLRDEKFRNPFRKALRLLHVNVNSHNIYTQSPKILDKKMVSQFERPFFVYSVSEEFCFRFSPL